MEAGIEGVYAPDVEEAGGHLRGCYPCVVVRVGAVLGVVGEVIEKEAVALVREVRIVTIGVVIPLGEVKLNAEVGAVGLHVTRSGGRLYGHYLPQAVQHSVYRHLVTGGEERREKRKEKKRKNKGQRKKYSFNSYNSLSYNLSLFGYYRKSAGLIIESLAYGELETLTVAEQGTVVQTEAERTLPALGPTWTVGAFEKEILLAHWVIERLLIFAPVLGKGK